MEDWSRQGLWRLDLQPCHVALTTLVADHNCITKLDALQACPNLQKVCVYSQLWCVGLFWECGISLYQEVLKV